MHSRSISALCAVLLCVLSAQRVTAQKYPYAEVLRKALLFYEAQRSGKMPANKKIPWKVDSHLQDGKAVNKDLAGGWYDAGDHVKFGLPMAASASMLLFGLEFLKEGYQSAGQFDYGKDQVKWALDYFRKCFQDKDRFYAQVGDGDIDHAWWGRPEDDPSPRPVYWVGAGKPMGGGDVMGATAAALAAGYAVFKDGGMLSDARALYNLAKQHPKNYNGIIPNVAKFYGNDEYRDELAHAAAWLAYAVGKFDGQYNTYIGDARRYLSELGGVAWAQSWNENRPATHFLMYKMTREPQYRSAIEAYIKEWLPGGSVQKTPQGLAWRQEWGANRYAANTALIALLAAKEGINGAQYFQFAKKQIDLMLGDAGRSYVVGFGNNFPQRAHHKGASCPNKPAACNWDNFNNKGPNPRVLEGALVGGPDAGGNYVDDRSQYKFTEVTTDYNAGFCGALAGIHYFSANPPK